MASSKHDVIVIGAGLSGLSAATRLKVRCPDLDVLVLEHGDRVGGRTYSVDITAPDGSIDVLDLGGHWVGSTQKEVLEVMKHFGVDYYKQNIDGENAEQDDPIYTQFRPVSVEVGSGKLRSSVSQHLAANSRSKPLR